MLEWVWQPDVVSGILCFVCALAILVLLICWLPTWWLGRPVTGKMKLTHLRGAASLLALAAILVTGWRLYLLPDKAGELQPDDTYALVLISTFWTLGPPSWFFVEYYWADMGGLDEPGDCDQKKKANREAIKTYADYASKIWAAVLALIVSLIAIKFKKLP